MRPTLPRRTLAVTVLSGVVLAGTTVSASAHVRVTPSTTASGAYSQLTFRVPNERDTTSTVKLTVTLPQADPFTSVSTKPVPGWRVSTTRAKLPRPVNDHGTTITEAVRTVTWTADPAAAIRPDQFQEFSMSVGKLPAKGRTVLLPADQTYSDGEVVRWNEAARGAQEPEHPAPVLVTTEAEDADAAAPVAQPASEEDPVDTTARWIGAAGLVLGLLGVGAGVLGWTRGRKDGVA